MSRTAIALLVGIGTAFIGSLLGLNASFLATDWQPLANGPGRGGLVNPATQQAYQVLGIALLVFGLAVTARAIGRWLFASEDGPSSRRPSAERTPHSPT
jgi:hypothetical protein